MTHSFTHIDPAQMIRGLAAWTDRGSNCVSVQLKHRTDRVFTKASWLESTANAALKTTVKTIFVTRGEGIPSDD